MKKDVEVAILDLLVEIENQIESSDFMCIPALSNWNSITSCGFMKMGEIKEKARKLRRKIGKLRI